MRITISIASSGSDDDQFLTLDLSESTSINDLKALVQHDTHIQPAQQLLYFNGGVLADGKASLKQLGIGNDDMLSLTVLEPQSPQMSRGASSAAAEQVRQQFLSDRSRQAALQAQNPEFAAALHDPARWAQMWDAERARREAEMQLMNDPFNPEGQAKIAEMIRKQAVNDNLNNALEHHPESFGRVHMLYIDVEVNNHPIKAFVDSGAQATVMSPDCAAKCGITHLIDENFAGVARGVGTARILGRVHSATLKIGGSFFQCSFTVMEGKDIDLLLGLDNLKRHQAMIDLKNDVLVINDTAVPFLGEADVPNRIEEAPGMENEPTIPGPGGSKLGAISGAVVKPPTKIADTSFRGQGQKLGGSSSLVASSSSQAQPASSSRSQPRQGINISNQRPGRRQWPPESISKLVELGLSKEQALDALDAADGNVDVAAGFLFG